MTTEDLIKSLCYTREQLETALDKGQLWVAMTNGNYWRCRRNGRTQTWKRNPAAFRIPIKFGLKFCSEITQSDLKLSGHFVISETAPGRFK